jgi:hypothetical protein
MTTAEETELCSDAPRGRKRKAESSQGSKDEDASIKIGALTTLAEKEEAKLVVVGEASAPAKPDEVTMKVTRIPLNPYMVWCVYNESGAEKRALVKVKKNTNFVPRMTFKARRPMRETERWIFVGRLPRRKGFW